MSISLQVKHSHTDVERVAYAAQKDISTRKLSIEDEIERIFRIEKISLQIVKNCRLIPFSAAQRLSDLNQRAHEKATRILPYVESRELRRRLSQTQARLFHLSNQLHVMKLVSQHFPNRFSDVIYLPYMTALFLAEEYDTTSGASRIHNVARISRGAFGEVCEADKHFSGRGDCPVFFKGISIRPYGSGAMQRKRHDSKLSAMIEESALMYALGSHPNIISVHFMDMDLKKREEYEQTVRLFQERGYASIHEIMNLYGPEKDLGEKLLRYLPFYAHQMLKGVGYMNDQGIIHQDLKPGNMVFTPSIEEDDVYDVKIIDFGLAAPNGACKPVEGTLPFIPPEYLIARQYKRSIPLTEKFDSWSLGVSLYVIITGEYLIKPEDVEMLVQDQIDAKIERAMSNPRIRPFLDHYPPGLMQSILQDLLCVNPKARLSADEVLIKYGRYFDIIDTPYEEEEIETVSSSPISSESYSSSDTEDPASEISSS